MAQLLGVHAEVLRLKAAPDVRRQRVLLRAGTRPVRLDRLEIRGGLARQLTAHRQSLPARRTWRPRP